MAITNPADVRSAMTVSQKARWREGFPASTTFGESTYTVGREGNEFYAYSNRVGLFFVSTTPQLVFDAIRNDMNNFNITGALIHVKTGTIIPVNILLDRDNTVLEGEGWQTFLSANNTSLQPVIMVTGDGCQVRDLGVRNTGDGMDAIILNGGNAKVHDVWVWGAGQDGIVTMQGNIEIRNCYIHDITRNGILTRSTAAVTRIIECYINGGTVGVVVSGFNTDIRGSYITGASLYGVHVGASDVKICENEIYSCLSGGIFITPGGPWALIANNDIWNIGGDGIHNSSGADSSVIQGNLLYSWTAEPIDNNEPDTTVEDNNCGGDVYNSKGCGFPTVQQAVDHQVTDGIIRIPAGIYTENVTLSGSNLVLRGEGQDTLIGGIGGSGLPAIRVTGDYCELQDLMATTVFISGADIVLFSGADYGRVNNVILGWSMRDGLRIVNSDYMFVDDIRIGNCLRHGIHVEDSMITQIVKNQIMLVNQNIIDLSGALDVIVNDNYMRSGYASVMIGAGCDRTTVMGNRMMNPGWANGVRDKGTNTLSSGFNNVG